VRLRILILVPIIALLVFAYCVRDTPRREKAPGVKSETVSAFKSAQTSRYYEIPDGPVSLAVARYFFSRWGGYMIWDHDVTEFALVTKMPTGPGRQFFEVRRLSDDFELREIAALTRPILDHGVLVLSAIRFTETTALRDEFYRTHPQAVPGQFLAPADRATPLPPRPPSLVQASRDWPATPPPNWKGPWPPPFPPPYKTPPTPTVPVTPIDPSINVSPTPTHWEAGGMQAVPDRPKAAEKPN
jgi:hypothetical protein